MYSHCSRSARGLAPPPPGNLKVKRNKVYQRKFSPIVCYIFSRTNNFLSYFLSSVPPGKKKEKAFRILLIIMSSLFSKHVNIHT